MYAEANHSGRLLLRPPLLVLRRPLLVLLRRPTVLLRGARGAGVPPIVVLLWRWLPVVLRRRGPIVVPRRHRSVVPMRGRWLVLGRVASVGQLLWRRGALL